MKLTQEQAIASIKTPASRSDIDAVKAQESQLRTFTEVLDMNELRAEGYWDGFKTRMKARSPRKFERVFSFARYPLPVTQISDSILSDFFKVFDGKNRHFNIDGDRDMSVLKNWVNDVNLDKWIEENAKLVFKNKPCSFVVVDRNDKGIPYLIFVDAERLIDAKFKTDKGDLEYITFVHSKGKNDQNQAVTRFAVYDEEKYLVYEKVDESDNYVDITKGGIMHGVGYCPAIAFISTPTNDKNLFKRRVAFSNALSSLEDWTINDVYANYVDSYVPFPVTEAPENKCPNPECKSGKVKREVIEDRESGKPRVYWDNCTACKDSESNLVMPGTHIGVKVDSEGKAPGSGVFKMHFPETDKMKHIPEKLDKIARDVRNMTIGVNSMEATKEALNEKQVTESVASKDTILIRTKTELDVLYKWIVTTAGNLYYKNLFLKVDANFGTEFYLITEADLQERFKQAKTIGLPQEEMLMIYEQLIDTKYKGNPNKIDRQKMLLKLDPMPMYTTAEVINLKDKNLVDPSTLSMKINFISFVTRFETENMPITQFGINLNPDKRIVRIKEELEKYNTELIAKLPKEPTVTEVIK